MRMIRRFTDKSLVSGIGESNESPLSTKRRVSSGELMAGQKELLIEHAGEEYRLRITSKGKLILTK